MGRMRRINNSMKSFIMLGAALVFVGAGCVETPAAVKPQEENMPVEASVQVSPDKAVVDLQKTEVNIVPAESVTKPPAKRTFTVTATEFSFAPSTITVKKGDVVQITMVNVVGKHGMAIPAFQVNRQVEEGQSVTFEFTADKVGTFPFFCNVLCGSGHREMTGSLIVEE